MATHLRTTDRVWPDMVEAEKFAWGLLETGRREPPNVYWKLPADLDDERCSARDGVSVGFTTPWGNCLAGMTMVVGRDGVWIMIVRQSPQQPPHETALFHEYLHAALIWAGAPWPHHSEACDEHRVGKLTAPPERDAAFFEEVAARNLAMQVAGF